MLMSEHICLMHSTGRDAWCFAAKAAALRSYPELLLYLSTLVYSQRRT